MKAMKTKKTIAKKKRYGLLNKLSSSVPEESENRVENKLVDVRG